MKVLLVNGSPHEKGCTYTALKEVENSLKEENIETEIFWIGNKPIGGCSACKKCAEIGKCVFDDSVNEFVEKAKDADGFIFGSPVHYAAASGNIASFMDRVFYSASSSGKGDYFRFKPASTVISARRAGTTATYDQLNKYFGINQMPIISSRYWNMVHGMTARMVHMALVHWALLWKNLSVAQPATSMPTMPPTISQAPTMEAARVMSSPLSCTSMVEPQSRMVKRIT